MLAWRLLLATGDPDCADVIERTMLNGVLSGRVARRAPRSSTSTRSSAGPTAVAAEPATASAQPWYACACCPPNLMRTVASWRAVPRDDRRPTGSSSTSTRPATIRARSVGGAGSGCAVETDYPWDGRVAGDRDRGPVASRGRCRSGCPAWCRRGDAIDWRATRRRRAAGGGRSAWSDHAARRSADRRRRDLELAMPVRITMPGPAGRRGPRLRRPRARPARLLPRDGRPARRRRASRTSTSTAGRHDRSRSRAPDRRAATSSGCRSPATAADGEGRVDARVRRSRTTRGPIGRSRRCGSGSRARAARLRPATPGDDDGLADLKCGRRRGQRAPRAMPASSCCRSATSSGVDRDAGVLAIKPSGVPYDGLTAGRHGGRGHRGRAVVEGELRPSIGQAHASAAVSGAARHRGRRPHPLDARRRRGPRPAAPSPASAPPTRTTSGARSR